MFISVESRGQAGSSDRFTLGVRLGDGSYRTQTYSYAGGKFTESIQTGSLLVPTDKGTKQVVVERKKKSNWAEDFLLVGSPGQMPKAPEVDAETAELIKGYSRTQITFVGPTFIGVEDSSEGAAKDGSSPFGYKELRMYSMAKPLDALNIGKVIPGADAIFTKTAASSYKKAPAKIREKITTKPDLTDWSLKFTTTGWKAYGRLGYLEEKDRGVYYEFPLPVQIPSTVAMPMSKQSTVNSPDGSWSITFEKGQIRLKTAAKNGTAAQQSVFKLTGAEIVMTIWSKRS